MTFLAQPAPLDTATGDIATMTWSPEQRVLYLTVPEKGEVLAIDPLKGTTFPIADQRGKPRQIAVLPNRYNSSNSNFESILVLASSLEME